MRLVEVQLREKVPTGPPGDMTARLSSADLPQASAGWVLDYEAGMLTASKAEHVLLIPVGNVAYMRPEPKAAKPVKAA